MTGPDGVLCTMGNASRADTLWPLTGKTSGPFHRQWGLCKLIFYAGVLRFEFWNRQHVIGHH